MSRATRASRALLPLLVLPAAGILFACKDAGTTVGRPLSIELTVDRGSGTAGVTAFTYQYQATGRSLLRVVLDFGDGLADTLDATGFTQAGGTRPHVYEEPGSYEAVATVWEVLGEHLADTVEVQVQAP